MIAEFKKSDLLYLQPNRIIWHLSFPVVVWVLSLFFALYISEKCVFCFWFFFGLFALLSLCVLCDKWELNVCELAM